MIKCPKCSAVSADVVYSGPVLFVRGTATVGTSGLLEAIGPARAELTVGVGKELNADQITLTCQNSRCGYTGLVKQFILVRQCMISGKEADLEFETPFGTTYWISSQYLDDARRIFSVENARPTEILEESLFYV